MRPAKGEPAPPVAPKKIAIVDVDPLYAKTATVLSRESYAAAWASYPAWDKACLVVGVAVPARDDEARAREVRDRFVKDVLPQRRGHRAGGAEGALLSQTAGGSSSTATTGAWSLGTAPVLPFLR